MRALKYASSASATILAIALPESLECASSCCLSSREILVFRTTCMGFPPFAELAPAGLVVKNYPALLDHYTYYQPIGLLRQCIHRP